MEIMDCTNNVQIKVEDCVTNMQIKEEDLDGSDFAAMELDYPSLILQLSEDGNISNISNKYSVEESNSDTSMDEQEEIQLPNLHEDDSQTSREENLISNPIKVSPAECLSDPLLKVSTKSEDISQTKLIYNNSGNDEDSSGDEFYDMLSKEALSFAEDKRNSKEDNGKKQKETELEISRTKLIYNGKSSDFKDPALLNWHKTGKDIQKDGIVFQKGFWTKYELDILNKNIENFKTAHAIKDFTKFFKRRKKKSDFSIDDENIFEVLSENINRPLMNVRRKIESLVLETGNKSNTKYTEKEIAKLLKLAEKYPNNWQLIGANMKRSRKSVHAKFKAITEKSKHTKTNRFSSSEDDKIREFVSESTNKNEINWKKLGNLLSRCPMSCKKRWLILSSGEERTSNKDTRTFYLRITKVLIEANISEPKDINWEMVLQKLGSNKNANIVKVKYRKWCDKHSDKLKGKSYCNKLKSLLLLMKNC